MQSLMFLMFSTGDFMTDEIKLQLYKKHSFFQDGFPFSICYEENRTEDFNMSKRFQRQFWKVTLITEGNGFFVVGERKFPFRKNTLIIVHPEELTTWDITGSKIMLYNILFDKTLLPADLNKLQDPLHLQGIFSTDLNPESAALWQIMNADSRICALVRAMYAEFNNNEINRESMLKLYLHQLILLLIRQSERKYRRHPDWTANYVQEYILKNYRDDISLSSIALELNLSRERLCRLYKAHFNRTIETEINTLRRNEALRLLQSGNFSPAETAQMAGFRNISQLNRLLRTFKKHSDFDRI